MRAVRPFFFALLGLGLLVGCAPATEDVEAADGALSEARAEDAALAERARDLAERASRRDPSVLRIPLSASDDDALPSTACGRWLVGLVGMEHDKKLVRGFFLVPENNAPAGSFAIVIAEPDLGVVATSVHVPDGTPNATRVARRLLDAVSADAAVFRPSGASTVKTQNVAGKAATAMVELIAKLLTGSGDAAVKVEARTITAVSHLVERASTAAWREFEHYFASPAALQDYLAPFVAVREQFAGRKIVLAEANDLAPDPDDIHGWLAANADLGTLLGTRLAGRTGEVAIAIRAENTYLYSVVAWAFQHDVPIVAVTPKNEPAAWFLTDFLTEANGTPAADILRAMAKDPAKTSLFHLVTAPEAHGTASWADRLPRGFAGAWALADEAIGLRVTDSKLGQWLGEIAGYVRLE